MDLVSSRSASLKKMVVICDTEPIAIEGLRALMAEHHDLAVAGEATSMMAGMELVRSLSACQRPWNGNGRVG